MESNIIEKWKDELTEIERTLQELMLSRAFFRGYQDIIKKNPVLKTQDGFLIWIVDNYLYSSSMSVRRLVDAHKDAISLKRLLLAIMKKPELLSKQRYISIFLEGSNFTRAEAEYFYNMLEGNNKTHIDPIRIKSLIAELDEKYDKLKEYIDQRIAHNAKIKTRKLPKIKDLDDCIDIIEKIVKELYIHFYAGSVMSYEPVFQYPWRKIFSVPWIRKI